MIKECSSCRALYTTDYCCSDGSLEDTIIYDLNKTPDLFQEPPQNCAKCGNPVDGHYCQGCALLRKKLKEDLFTYCIENRIFQDFQNTFEPSNDNTNVVNALQEPFVVKQDPGKNSSQSPPHINHHCCYGCGDSLEDIFCHQCTCESCEKVYINTLSWDRPSICYNDNDDEDCTIAITPILLTVELEDSLRMGDEHLDTILEKELDEFIKSSVENLIPSPSESEDLSESECDVPACDNFTTFSNLLFDVDNDFSSSDDESFSDEGISKKIYSNPLFDEEIIFIKIDPYHFNAESDLIESLLNQDSLIVSSSLKIDYLLDEFASELILLKSIPLRIDKADCDPKEEIHFVEILLYDNSYPRPLKEFNSKNFDVAIESFFPSPILVEDSDPFMEEIDLFLTSDGSIPSGIDNDFSNSEGIIFF
uniref:Pre-mRNA splicing Prp18-interacting factor n=1 Tax=Tanacetum cinerariifolium TaxID=118510 RepID=A0A699H6N0_TANCI|nr:hypothetical protein [Tanacetum cinerariifolium]